MPRTPAADRLRNARLAAATLFGVALAACSDTPSPVAPAGSAPLAAELERIVAASPALPELLASAPVARASDVPRSEWLRLSFAGDVSPGAAAGLVLACDGARIGASVIPLAARELLVNPDGELPAAAACVLHWRGPQGPRQIAFTTAGAGLPAFVHYDRRERRGTAPFPDDYWLRAGAEGDTQERLAIEFSGFSEPSQTVISTFVSGAQGLDGFSPIAHLTIGLSEAPDPASLPQTPEQSLDPLASVGLFDLTPGSPGFASRVPFRLEARSDAMGAKAVSHALLLFPSQPLTPGGRYGLVVTRRARASAARPFEPSPFFAKALAPRAAAGEDPSLPRVRALAGDVLDAVASAALPPIPRDDVALAVRISVRSTGAIPNDLLAIREEILAAPPPAVSIASVAPENAEALAAGSEVAAIVTGTWQAPDFRGKDGHLARDPVSGRPLRTRTHPIGFVLALPRAAQQGPVPVTLYQHGNPGSAEEEVVEQARRTFAGAGFAVIGFTDVVNREVSPPGPDLRRRAEAQLDALFFHLLWRKRVPDSWTETNAEQLAFLRAIAELARTQRFVLPAGAGAPARELFGIDAAQPLTIEGVSEGASLAASLLPYAPEIRAAALVVGGRRYSEVLIHQQARVILRQFAAAGVDDLSATDVWVALALLQTLFDPQDPHLHAPFLWRERLALGGTQRRASVLLVEGVGDGYVPNHATEALGLAFGGMALVEPGRAGVPGFTPARAPFAGNVDSETTGALVQWTPLGIADRLATPGCSEPLAGPVAWEGHHCAQSAIESRIQRAEFFRSALRERAPVVVDALEH